MENSLNNIEKINKIKKQLGNQYGKRTRINGYSFSYEFDH